MSGLCVSNLKWNLIHTYTIIVIVKCIIEITKMLGVFLTMESAHQGRQWELSVGTGCGPPCFSILFATLQFYFLNSSLNWLYLSSVRIV
jgi:hypothetical protein